MGGRGRRWAAAVFSTRECEYFICLHLDFISVYLEMPLTSALQRQDAQLRRAGHFVQPHAHACTHIHMHGQRKIARLVILIALSSGLRPCFDLIGLHPLTRSCNHFMLLFHPFCSTIDPHTPQPLCGDSGVGFLSCQRRPHLLQNGPCDRGVDGLFFLLRRKTTATAPPDWLAMPQMWIPDRSSERESSLFCRSAFLLPPPRRSS